MISAAHSQRLNGTLGRGTLGQPCSQAAKRNLWRSKITDSSIVYYDSF